MKEPWCSLTSSQNMHHRIVWALQKQTPLGMQHARNPEGFPPIDSSLHDTRSVSEPADPVLGMDQLTESLSAQQRQCNGLGRRLAKAEYIVMQAAGTAVHPRLGCITASPSGFGHLDAPLDAISHHLKAKSASLARVPYLSWHASWSGSRVGGVAATRMIGPLASRAMNQDSPPCGHQGASFPFISERGKGQLNSSVANFPLKGARWIFLIDLVPGDHKKPGALSCFEGCVERISVFASVSLGSS
ncbi:hypothetical protein P175DRAFT_0535526 [Aspergillus ochraceoroseus IBT 24754]|uniref:Uncharacterized protein n=1 Tax=Aspergillus ochraceoroseus IBT 24754 TaxID=1392256 RepID=A0A2T5LNC0_9EURO|nr:uncharacterized protein P175DRAFT_0535526 [Aspergillus ochraceoroseus IBT 24754]PTU17781.1 hypothetical protein P175DRAFT_0535526 [Aspergillus ochraceoroseus IBT 24754]